MGAQRAFEGRILFLGTEIQRLRTEEIVRLGIVYVPEEKMLFRPLSVEENLLLGAYMLNDQARIRSNLDSSTPFSRPQGSGAASPHRPFPAASSRWWRSAAG